jgi:hypothetical protein
MFGGQLSIIGWMISALSMGTGLAEVLFGQLPPTQRNSFLLLSPVFGLAFVILELPARLRDLRLLRYGVVALGKLVDKHEAITLISDPNGGVDHVLVRTLTLEYKVGDNTYSATVRRFGPAPLGGDRAEALLCDPRSPSCVRTLDHFPELRVTTSGALEAGPGPHFGLLVSPVLFVCFLAATVISLGILEW